MGGTHSRTRTYTRAQKHKFRLGLVKVGRAHHHANTHAGEDSRCPPESKCRFSEGPLQSTYVQVRRCSLVSASSQPVSYITPSTRGMSLLPVTGRMHCTGDNTDFFPPADISGKAVIGSKVHLSHGQGSKPAEVKGHYPSIHPLCKTDTPHR